MTRDEARKILAETRCFSRVGELVSLREIALIEAVRDYEAARSAGLSTPSGYAQPQQSRSS